MGFSFCETCRSTAIRQQPKRAGAAQRGGKGAAHPDLFGVPLSIRGKLPYGCGLTRLIATGLAGCQDYPVPTDRHHKLKELQMRASMLLVMVMAASAANAQQVYKCVSGKDVSYQSAPCGATQTVAGQWDATPEPEPSAEELKQLELKRKHGRAESAWLSHVAGTDRARSVHRGRQSSSVRSSLSRCDVAKARREAKLKSVGLKRTFDLLRKLDDSVYEACK